MALPILDGNQSATTLSSILTSGEHIPAHTVVSLGTQAITDISGAVSGSVVSISNFPATQPVSIASVTIGNSVTISSLPPLAAGTAQIGSVTASVTNPVTVGAIVGPIGGSVFKGGSGSTDAIRALPYFSQNGSANYNELSTNNPLPIAGTITIGSLPAISGTVTANVTILDTNSGSNVVFSEDGGIFPDYGLQVGFVDNLNYRLAGSSHPFPISGTVTVGNSVTIASFATSVTARLINPAGTAVTYAEVGTAGSPSIDVLSVQGVTAGSACHYGTVTATLLSSTVITSGSFTSLASATLVPGNTARKMATVYNLGAGQLFVNAGATATTLGGGFMVALSSGDFYECDYTTTTLSAIFATAGTASWMSH
jgi:hypothetical protein